MSYGSVREASDDGPVPQWTVAKFGESLPKYEHARLG